MMSRVLKTATALLAFMLMASVAVWAAPAVTAPTVSVDGATGNVTVSTQINDGGTPLPGKQVTMLTYLGTPTDTSIIGIDQDASDTNGNKSFTFGTDGTTPNGTYTVLVGGEDVNTAASATMDFTKSIEINPVPSPVPVSQPVTLTAVAKLNGTENVSYNSAITWSADGGTITPDAANPAQATFTAAAAGTYTVTATLGDVSNTTSVVVQSGGTDALSQFNNAVDLAAAQAAFEALNIDRSQKYSNATPEEKAAIVQKLMQGRPYTLEADVKTALDSHVAVVTVGDCNKDGNIDMGDISSIISYINFEIDVSAPEDVAAFDVTNDTNIDMGDISAIISYINFEISSFGTRYVVK